MDPPKRSPPRRPPGWVVLAAWLVYHIGIWTGWWTPDNAVWAQVDALFAFLGLGSIRFKLADLLGTLDLAKVKAWLAGYRTYVLVVLHVISVDNEIVLAVDAYTRSLQRT